MNARNDSLGQPRRTSSVHLMNLANRFNRHAFGAFCVLSIVYPQVAPALGFRIPNQDAEATAKGNAFMATADNPSAIYYNPAGITQIQSPEAQFGLHVISVNSHFDAAAGGSSDSNSKSRRLPRFIAFFRSKMPPKDHRISLGLGI